MKKDNETLRALYAQIEVICRHFQEIRQEAAGIAASSRMPDATLHLNDVLKSTEHATHTILDTAGNIDSITQSSSMAAADKEKINAQVSAIYEACSFQDISGQRIKKVLSHLSELEYQLTHLSKIARGETKPARPESKQRTDSHLLNGPALSNQAPSQADIDALFKRI